MKLFYLINILILFILQLVHEILAGEGLTAYSFLFGGMGSEGSIHHLNFQPDDGLKFRKKYEAKHGPRGQYLIEKLGKGFSNEGTTLLDPDQALTKLPKNKLKRYKTKSRKNDSSTETTTFSPRILSEQTLSDITTTDDITTNIYDSTIDPTYDSTTIEYKNDYSI